MFTAKDVSALRSATGAGMMDCKKALEATDGDMEKATVWLREKGIAAAAKKSDRIAAEGIVASYIHMGGKIGVLVEINCETDFVAKSPRFAELAKDVAMQIAAAKPTYVNVEDVDPSALENEKEILRNQALNEGKPEHIVDKMVEGRIKKYYQEVCLYEQPFVKDSSKTIREMINEAIMSIGEKITIRRFTRYEMGEGLEKRVNDLAAEVAAQIAGN
jgi:elongation factor Ts